MTQIKKFPEFEFEQLKEFAEKFGAEPWIGVRFDRLDWFFLGADDLKRTRRSFRFSLKNAKRIGLLFEELIEQAKDL